jgi:excisionase family DNA binding protein
MPLTVTRKQAAALVGCDTKTIDRAIAAKKLRASKGAFGDRVVIRLADIERALDANPA